MLNLGIQDLPDLTTSCRVHARFKPISHFPLPGVQHMTSGQSLVFCHRPVALCGARFVRVGIPFPD